MDIRKNIGRLIWVVDYNKVKRGKLLKVNDNSFYVKLDEHTDDEDYQYSSFGWSTSYGETRNEAIDNFLAQLERDKSRNRQEIHSHFDELAKTVEAQRVSE